MASLPDFKDRRGEWVRSVEYQDRKVWTHSWRKWENLVERCKVGGVTQRKIPAYVGCTNEFAGFEAFVDWHQMQVGYGSEHELDKDLLVRGNKAYSADTCVLIPNEINMLITEMRASRALPQGVSFDARRGKYRTRCTRKHWLGYFATPDLAFQKYKDFKEALLRDLAERHRSHIDPRAYAALMEYEVTPY